MPCSPLRPLFRGGNRKRVDRKGRKFATKQRHLGFKGESIKAVEVYHDHRSGQSIRSPGRGDRMLLFPHRKATFPGY
ncbi:MAG: hypothetical protein ABRQ26_08450 [Syntrophomonadaceae bacterium]